MWVGKEARHPSQRRHSSVGSVLGSLSCLMHRCGFDPALSFRQRWVSFYFFFFGGGGGVNMGSPFPQNSFGSEYRARSSLRTNALRRTDSKDTDIHVLDG